MSLRLRHPVYFLVAFIAACLSWYAATGKRRATISVRSVRTSLTLVNLPSDLILTSGVPDTVTLQLRGPLPLLSQESGNLEVYLDLSEARPGKNAYQIDPSDLDVPPEIEVLSVEPAEIELELERLIIRSIPVRPRLVGQPAPGFEIGAVRAQPEKIRIQGPELHLKDLKELSTEALSVEGATETLETEVGLQLDDPFLRTVGSAPLKLRVEILPVTTPTPVPRRRR